MEPLGTENIYMDMTQERVVIRWLDGAKVTSRVRPQPITPDEARLLLKTCTFNRGGFEAIKDRMNDRQVAYIDLIWSCMPDDTSWMSAFFSVLNDRHGKYLGGPDDHGTEEDPGATRG